METWSEVNPLRHFWLLLSISIHTLPLQEPCRQGLPWVVRTGSFALHSHQWGIGAKDKHTENPTWSCIVLGWCLLRKPIWPGEKGDWAEERPLTQISGNAVLSVCKHGMMHLQFPTQKSAIVALDSVPYIIMHRFKLNCTKVKDTARLDFHCISGIC